MPDRKAFEAAAQIGEDDNGFEIDIPLPIADPTYVFAAPYRVTIARLTWAQAA